MKAKILLSTFSNLENASKIAEILIKNDLAACCNIIPNITSIYKWENKIQKDNEFQMIIKTSDNKIKELEKTFIRLHKYDVPEFIIIDPEYISSDYLNWMKSILDE
ncbi:UNVERIFIED_CONTAM: hypothetical protein GTU68_052821 [Idotea baltica]|nr:hypothetical protein [Idotea baltica]